MVSGVNYVGTWREISILEWTCPVHKSINSLHWLIEFYGPGRLDVMLPSSSLFESH